MAFLTEPEPARGAVLPVLPGIGRIIAKNPGPMTYHGTNTYLIDTPDGLAVLDPGPDSAAHVQDILNAKLTKRGVDIKCLEISDKIEKVSGNKVKRGCEVKVGVEIELAKKIVKHIKDSKLKVQASIQGDTVRISGKKRDDLQEAIAFVKKTITEFPLQYQNFRD